MNTSTSDPINPGNKSFEFRYAQTSELARLVIDKGLPEILKVEQVALVFQVHKETIRRWENRGQIEALRVKKGQRSDRRFKREEIIRVLEKGLRKPA